MPTDSHLVPTKVKAPHGARQFEISWQDAVTSRIPHKVLRGYCPCAQCQGHQGTIRFVDGGNQELREISRVGSYALSLTWGDGHSGGIYTFAYLRKLGDLVATAGADALCALECLPD
jgi:DUF971 family protein